MQVEVEDADIFRTENVGELTMRLIQREKGGQRGGTNR